MSNQDKKPSIRQMPTSPHMQIYRWNIGSLTSIMHRFTGIMLYFSLVAISWYIVYYTYQIDISQNSNNCDCLRTKIINFIICGASIGLIFSLYFHFCNGIRHLLWNIGKGFEKQQAKFNGYLVLGISVVLTLLTIITVFYFRNY